MTTAATKLPPVNTKEWHETAKRLSWLPWERLSKEERDAVMLKQANDSDLLEARG